MYYIIYNYATAYIARPLAPIVDTDHVVRVEAAAPETGALSVRDDRHAGHHLQVIGEITATCKITP